MQLKEIREKLPTVMAMDFVPIVKEIYPKFDFPLLSKVGQPQKYGVDLRKDALKAICTHFGVEEDPPKNKENRKMPCRIYGRLYESEYIELMGYIKEDGYSTMQDFLVCYLRKYIKQKRKERKSTVMKPIVGVNFKNSYTDEYYGRTYNYFCDIPVVLGDIVIAPTAKGESEAMVVAVEVHPASIDPHILEVLKTITTLAPEAPKEA